MSDESADSDTVEIRSRAQALHDIAVTPANSLALRAEVWGLLADLLISDYLHHWNGAGPRELVQAEWAVEEALKLAPQLAVAHYANGFVQRAKGQHREALAAFDQATRHNPKFTRAYAQKANELINVGRPQEASALIDEAIERSPPHDPSLGTFYWITGRAYFFAGKYTEAIPRLRRSVELRSMDWYNRLYLVSASALADQKEEAKKHLDEFNRIPQFHGYTVARVAMNEHTNPNADAVVVAGRKKFHEGLILAGLPAT